SVTLVLEPAITSGGERLPGLRGPVGTDFGDIPVGSSPPTMRWMIRNTGGDSVNILGVSVSPGFSMLHDPVGPLAPGASATVSAQLHAAAVGARAGSLVIATDDPAQPETTVPLQGTVLARRPPEIRVTGNGRNIPHGNPRPLVVNFTDFGWV